MRDGRQPFKPDARARCKLELPAFDHSLELRENYMAGISRASFKSCGSRRLAMAANGRASIASSSAMASDSRRRAVSASP